MAGKRHRSGLDQRWHFLREYFREPNVVGALAPSSRALAAALCEPYRRYQQPATVLEVGAGTGAITRYLGTILGEEDELDICEMQPDFTNILRRDVLSSADLAPAVSQGRVRLLEAPVQELTHENRYDFIISCLPLTTFDLCEVQEVFAVLRRCLKPSGVLSYFEYMGVRRTSSAFAIGKRRKRIRSVSSFLNRNIHAHQFKRRSVFQNIPPAHARYLRFTD